MSQGRGNRNFDLDGNEFHSREIPNEPISRKNSNSEKDSKTKEKNLENTSTERRRNQKFLDFTTGPDLKTKKPEYFSNTPTFIKSLQTTTISIQKTDTPRNESRNLETSIKVPSIEPQTKTNNLSTQTSIESRNDFQSRNKRLDKIPPIEVSTKTNNLSSETSKPLESRNKRLDKIPSIELQTKTNNLSSETSKPFESRNDFQSRNKRLDKIPSIELQTKTNNPQTEPSKTFETRNKRLDNETPREKMIPSIELQTKTSDPLRRISQTEISKPFESRNKRLDDETSGEKIQKNDDLRRPSQTFESRTDFQSRNKRLDDETSELQTKTNDIPNPFRRISQTQPPRPQTTEPDFESTIKNPIQSKDIDNVEKNELESETLEKTSQTEITKTKVPTTVIPSIDEKFDVLKNVTETFKPDSNIPNPFSETKTLDDLVVPTRVNQIDSRGGRRLDLDDMPPVPNIPSKTPNKITTPPKRLVPKPLNPVMPPSAVPEKKVLETPSPQISRKIEEESIEDVPQSIPPEIQREIIPEKKRDFFEETRPEPKIQTRANEIPEIKEETKEDKPISSIPRVPVKTKVGVPPPLNLPPAAIPQTPLERPKIPDIVKQDPQKADVLEKIAKKLSGPSVIKTSQQEDSEDEEEEEIIAENESPQKKEERQVQQTKCTEDSKKWWSGKRCRDKITGCSNFQKPTAMIVGTQEQCETKSYGFMHCPKKRQKYQYAYETKEQLEKYLLNSQNSSFIVLSENATESRDLLESHNVYVATYSECIEGEDAALLLSSLSNGQSIYQFHLVLLIVFFLNKFF